MTGNLSTAIKRPVLPTPADIERRRAELLNHQLNHPRQQSPPASAEPPAQPAKRPLPANAPPPIPNELSTPPPPRTPAELRLDEAALYGPAGLAVRTMAPHTEAHTAAILLQLLAVFGNVVGPGPHCMVGATRHGLNLFVVLVGESSKGRKGTSWNQIARLFSEVDRPWLDTRVTTARLTPSGLVYTLRDQESPPDRPL